MSEGRAEGVVVAVVPAFNEVGSVAEVVRGLRSLVPPPAVVVVDDGSTDGTGPAAREAGAVVLRPPYNLGIGGAVQTGFRYARAAGARACVQVDGDGQHPPDQLERVLAPVLSGEVDVTIGSRFLGTDGDRSTGVRRAGMGWLSMLIRLRCGRWFTDPTSGLRAYGPAALDWLADHYPDDYPEPQMLAPMVRRGLRVSEVPVAMEARTAGLSSIRGGAPLVYMAKVSVAVLFGSVN